MGGKEMKVLLLKDGEICKAVCGDEYCMQEDMFPCGRFAAYKAQAQLDKILNQPWLDKPDSEGWWWFIGKYFQYQTTWFDLNLYCVEIKTNEKVDALYSVQYHDVEPFLKYKGKWQKAIVPEPPEEDCGGFSIAIDKPFSQFIEEAIDGK